MALPAATLALLTGDLLESLTQLGGPFRSIRNGIDETTRSFDKLAASANRFYTLALRSNQKLNDQIRSGSTVLASQLDLYDSFGNEVSDFGNKIDAIIPKVALLQKELERRTADIAGATTKVTNEVLNQILINFNTVQGQSKQFADDFESILSLAESFTSVISTFQLPEFQIPQEVRSVLQGDINNINTLIARQTALSKSEFELARARGEAVDFLVNKFDAFNEAQDKFRGSLTNSLSIIEDIFDQLRREAGAPLFEKTEQGVEALTKVIENEGLRWREIFEDSTQFGEIFGDTANAILAGFERIGDSLQNLLDKEDQIVEILNFIDFAFSEFITVVTMTISALIKLTGVVVMAVTEYKELTLIIIGLTGAILGLNALFNSGINIMALFLSTTIALDLAIAALTVAVVILGLKLALIADNFEKIPDNKKLEISLVGGRKVIREVDVIKTELEKLDDEDEYTLFLRLEDRTNIEAALDAIKNIILKFIPTITLAIGVFLDSLSRLIADAIRVIANTLPNSLFKAKNAILDFANEVERTLQKVTFSNTINNFGTNLAKKAIPNFFEAEKRIRDFSNQVETLFDILDKRVSDALAGESLSDLADKYVEAQNDFKKIDKIIGDVTLDTSFDPDDIKGIIEDYRKAIEESDLDKVIKEAYQKKLDSITNIASLRSFTNEIKQEFGKTEAEILREVVNLERNTLNNLIEERNKIGEQLRTTRLGTGISEALQAEFDETQSLINERRDELGKLLVSISPEVAKLRDQLDRATRPSSGAAVQEIQKIEEALRLATKTAKDSVDLIGRNFLETGNAFNQQFIITQNAIKKFLTITGDISSVTVEDVENLLTSVTRGVQLGVIDIQKAIDALKFSLNTETLNVDQRSQIQEKIVELIEIQNNQLREVLNTEKELNNLELEKGNIIEEELSLRDKIIERKENEAELTKVQAELESQNILRVQGAQKDIDKRRQIVLENNKKILSGEIKLSKEKAKIELASNKEALEAIALEEKALKNIEGTEQNLLLEKQKQLKAQITTNKLQEADLKVQAEIAKLNQNSLEKENQLTQERLRNEIIINNLRLQGLSDTFSDREDALNRENDSAKQLELTREKLAELLEAERLLREELLKLIKEGSLNEDELENKRQQQIELQQLINDEKIKELELTKDNLADQLALNEAIRAALEDEINRRLEINLAVQEYKSALLDAADIQNELRAQLLDLQESVNQLDKIKIGVKLTGLDAVKDLQNELAQAPPGSDLENLIKQQIADVKEVAGISNKSEADRINLIEERQKLEQEISKNKFNSEIALLDIEKEKQKIAIDTANFELKAALQLAKIKQSENKTRVNNAKENLGLLEDEENKVNEIVISNTLKNASEKERQEFLEEGLDKLNEQYGTNLKDLDVLQDKYSNEKKIKEISNDLVESISERTGKSEEEVLNNLEILSNLEQQNELSNQELKNAELLLENGEKRKDNLDEIFDSQKEILKNQKEGEESERILNDLLEKQEVQRERLNELLEAEVNNSNKLSSLQGDINSLLITQQGLIGKTTGSIDIESIVGNPDALNNLANTYEALLNTPGQRGVVETFDQRTGTRELLDGREYAELLLFRDEERLRKIGEAEAERIKNVEAQNKFIEEGQKRILGGLTIEEYNRQQRDQTSNTNTNTDSPNSSRTFNLSNDIVSSNTDAIQANTNALEDYQEELDEANRIRREAAGLFDESESAARFRIENELLTEVGNILKEARDNTFENEIIRELFETNKITKSMALTLLGVESGLTTLSDEDVINAIINGDVTELIRNQQQLESDGSLFLDPNTGRIIASGEIPDFESLSPLVELLNTDGNLLTDANEWIRAITEGLIGLGENGDILNGLYGGTGVFDQLDSIRELPSFQDSGDILSGVLTNNGSALRVQEQGNTGVDQNTNLPIGIDLDRLGEKNESFTNGEFGTFKNPDGTTSTRLGSFNSTDPTITEFTRDSFGFLTPDYTTGNAQSDARNKIIRDYFYNKNGIADPWNDANNLINGKAIVAEPPLLEGYNSSEAFVTGNPDIDARNEAITSYINSINNGNNAIGSISQGVLLARDSFSLGENFTTEESPLTAQEIFTIPENSTIVNSLNTDVPTIGDTFNYDNTNNGIGNARFNPAKSGIISPFAQAAFNDPNLTAQAAESFKPISSDDKAFGRSNDLDYLKGNNPFNLDLTKTLIANTPGDVELLKELEGIVRGFANVKPSEIKNAPSTARGQALSNRVNKQQDDINRAQNIYNTLIQNPNQFGSTQLLLTQTGG